MKTLDELINRQEPGWPMVQQWISEAVAPVEILPPIDDEHRERALWETQVTTRSPMGAVVYETGGILIDHGWLRILGSGHPRLPRSLPDWNRGRSYRALGERPSFILIADDAIGGFFAIDGGGLRLEPGKICYFAPDCLEWEKMSMGYSDFLIWSLGGKLAQFYEGFRWSGWEDEVKLLAGDKTMGIFPFLSASGPPIDERHRAPVSVSEAYQFHCGDTVD